MLSNYLQAPICVAGRLYALQISGALHVLCLTVSARTTLVAFPGASETLLVVIAGPCGARAVQEALVVAPVPGEVLTLSSSAIVSTFLFASH